jgi:hypothetical protein
MTPGPPYGELASGTVHRFESREHLVGDDITPAKPQQTLRDLSVEVSDIRGEEVERFHTLEDSETVVRHKIEHFSEAHEVRRERHLVHRCLDNDGVRIIPQTCPQTRDKHRIHLDGPDGRTGKQSA